MHTLTKYLLCALACSLSHAAHALTIFACEPEWGALARVMLPDATIKTATHHLQDPHHIEARPSLIAQMRNADVAVCTGAELETGWLPMLQEKSGNRRVQDGQKSMFYAADHVQLIDPFTGTKTPFSGDVHAQGNPHFHTDPRRYLQVAKALAERLSMLFPDRQANIKNQQRQFEQQLLTKITQWELKAKPLQGRKVLTQHASFAYLWAWLGMQVIADLEPKPGVPPTPQHLEKVLAIAKSNPQAPIIVAQHHDPKPARWLAQQLGTSHPVLVLPATVPTDQADGIITWFDAMVNQLLTTLR